MSFHSLQLPTGQGHLKIKLVLAWQHFLAEQSPTYHEVVRWLVPSHGYPWVSDNHPLSVLRVEVALGAGESCAKWWMGTLCGPVCLHGIPVVPAGDQELAQVFQELAVSQAWGQGDGRQDLGTCFPGCAFVTPCSVGVVSFAGAGNPPGPTPTKSQQSASARRDLQ